MHSSSLFENYPRPPVHIYKFTVTQIREKQQILTFAYQLITNHLIIQTPSWLLTWRPYVIVLNICRPSVGAEPDSRGHNLINVICLISARKFLGSYCEVEIRWGVPGCGLISQSGRDTQNRQIKAIVLRHRNTSLPLMAHRLKCTVYKWFDFNGRHLLSRGLCNCSTKGDVETGEWGERARGGR